MTATFAVFGDIHGHQDLMYEKAIQLEKDSGRSIDAVLQVGDFETIRTEEDFRHYHAPHKYHRMSDFSGYYKGNKKAPFLTVFIAGNHEAWGVLARHQQGGFVAPNIYFLGRSGMIDVKGVKIAGLSGVYGSKAYDSPLSDEPGYDWKYYRKAEVDRLKTERPDILLLHEWMTPVSLLTTIGRMDDLIVPEQMWDAGHTPATDLVLASSPRYLFMGHTHVARLHGVVEGTEVFGLQQLKQGSGDGAYRLITL
jgi:lariat debranching enzyme